MPRNADRGSPRLRYTAQEESKARIQVTERFREAEQREWSVPMMNDGPKPAMGKVWGKEKIA